MHQNSKVGKTVPRTGKSKHHVPPTNPDPAPRPRILIKSQKHHDAYHLLFGAASSFESSVEILRRDWWTDKEGNLIK